MLRFAPILVLPVLFGLVATGASAAEIGDAERGASLWRKCKSCHMVGQGARNRVGPHLNELFGRKAASVEDYNC